MYLRDDDQIGMVYVLQQYFRTHREQPPFHAGFLMLSHQLNNKFRSPAFFGQITIYPAKYLVCTFYIGQAAIALGHQDRNMLHIVNIQFKFVNNP